MKFISQHRLEEDMVEKTRSWLLLVLLVVGLGVMDINVAWWS